MTAQFLILATLFFRYFAHLITCEQNVHGRPLEQRLPGLHPQVGLPLVFCAQLLIQYRYIYIYIYPTTLNILMISLQSAAWKDSPWL